MKRSPIAVTQQHEKVQNSTKKTEVCQCIEFELSTAVVKVDII